MKLNFKEFKISKKIILISLLVAFFVFAVCFHVVMFTGVLSVDVSEANVQRVEVPQGTSVKRISKILKKQNLIRNEFVFYLCARYRFLDAVYVGSENRFALKSGVYHISSDMNVKEVFKVLSSGKQEYIHVSIPEGLTISKIGERLEKAGVCSAVDFREACYDPELVKRYDFSGPSLEGYLFPDTYYLAPYMSGEAVCDVMISNFYEKLKGIKHSESLSQEQINDAVVLASIIEREYRIPEEAPVIASVFKNRLRYNIGLYSCATVEYIITEIEGRPHPDVITYKDLAHISPYNTYKWAGLPPGAISNPGLVALDAAINPAKTNYYYFRVVDQAKGKHVFSKDFETHISEGYSAKTKK